MLIAGGNDRSRLAPTRRAVLAALLSAPAVACAGARGITRNPARPLGLASLTVARELAADYRGTLHALQAMGYTHFGFPLAAQSPRQQKPRDPLEVAAMLAETGLSVGVLRLGYAESVELQMELAAKVGARIVAQSASPVFFTGSRPGTATRAEFEGWLPRLAELSRAAQAAGLRLVYHNHAWDHVPLDGLTPLEIIARSFASGEVDFEVDLAWAYLAGVDPLEIVRELGSRVQSLHFKDVDPARGPDPEAQLVSPGEGVLDFMGLIPALDRVTDALGHVEVDRPSDGLTAARRGARTIQQARGQVG